jgi:hypothetical protein
LAKEGGIGELVTGFATGFIVTAVIGGVACYILGSVGKRYGL